MALRSHWSPNTSSNEPTSNRKTSIGMRVSAGPSAATAAANEMMATATPMRVDRHSRVTPTASTMVSASTISTALARPIGTNTYHRRRHGSSTTAYPAKNPPKANHIPTRAVTCRTYSSRSPMETGVNSVLSHRTSERIPTKRKIAAAANSAAVAAGLEPPDVEGVGDAANGPPPIIPRPERSCRAAGRPRQQLDDPLIGDLREGLVPLPHGIEGLRCGEGPNLVGLLLEAADRFPRRHGNGQDDPPGALAPSPPQRRSRGAAGGHAVVDHHRGLRFDRCGSTIASICSSPPNDL